MRIGINGYEAVIPRFGYDENGLPRRVGSSEVCFQLITKFAEIDDKNEYVIYLPKSPTPDMPKEREGFYYQILPEKKLWTVLSLNRKILSEKFDIFFSPTHYGLLYSGYPEILLVLDVSYKLFPDMFKKKDIIKFNTWGKYSIKKAAKILTISESSKRDIIREYGISKSKIETIYLGTKEIKNKMNKSEFIKKYDIKSPYILFVGTLQPRKNIVRLIESFSKISKTRRDLNLAIVGRKGWDYEDILLAPKKNGVEDKVRFFENITDDVLPSFYENAELFVLPSLYEGFGLPVLEAMKCGCPVVTSNVSSLPEAGGDAAIYFDPKNTDDMAEKILKVLNNNKLRSDMIKKGYNQLEKFSWEKSARQVLDVFEEIAK